MHTFCVEQTLFYRNITTAENFFWNAKDRNAHVHHPPAIVITSEERFVIWRKIFSSFFIVAEVVERWAEIHLEFSSFSGENGRAIRPFYQLELSWNWKIFFFKWAWNPWKFQCSFLRFPDYFWLFLFSASIFIHSNLHRSFETWICD